MGHEARRRGFDRWKPRNGTAVAAQIYDRFGREIGVGDILLVSTEQIRFWQVQEVRPALEPGIPAGMVHLVLTAVFASAVKGGQAIGDLVKVQDVGERSQAQVATPDAEPSTVGPRPVEES